MLAAGQSIGSYRVVRELGRGGMGAVFEVVHQELGRKAAIKVLHAHFSRDPQLASRFFNEARAVSIVDHPGLVDIIEFGHLPDGTAYLVMELLKGESLRARLEQADGPLGPEALRLARQIASALEAAHDKGIVHRDLKPDNVMIVPDPEAPGGERAKILDFGIAKLAADIQRPDGDMVRTEAGVLLGTPTYMAPEQCRGAGEVDARADVYSLGVILYQMLSGKLPFTGQGAGVIMALHLMKEPPPLREAEPAVPEELAALVHAMLRKDAQERPDMGQVVAELERLGAARTTTLPALGTGSFRPPASPGSFSGLAPSIQVSGRGRLLAAAGVAVLISVAVAGLAVQGARRGGRRPGSASVAGAPALHGPRPGFGQGKVRWSLQSTPEGVDIVALPGQQVLGQTPWVHEEDRGAGEVQVELRRDGFFPEQIRLPRGADVERSEVLVPRSDEKVPILN